MTNRELHYALAELFDQHYETHIQDVSRYNGKPDTWRLIIRTHHYIDHGRQAIVYYEDNHLHCHLHVNYQNGGSTSNATTPKKLDDPNTITDITTTIHRHLSNTNLSPNKPT